MKKVLVAVALALSLVGAVSAQSAVNVINGPSYSFKFYNSDSSATIKSTKAYLKSVIVGVPCGSTYTAHIALYNVSSAIGTATPIIQLDPRNVGTFEVNAWLSTGLFITTDSTAAVTVIYK